jgi:hypothetical protein
MLAVKRQLFCVYLQAWQLAISAAPESKTVHKSSELEGRTRHFDLLQG